MSFLHLCRQRTACATLDVERESFFACLACNCLLTHPLLCPCHLIICSQRPAITLSLLKDEVVRVIPPIPIPQWLLISGLLKALALTLTCQTLQCWLLHPAPPQGLVFSLIFSCPLSSRHNQLLAFYTQAGSHFTVFAQNSFSVSPNSFLSCFPSNLCSLATSLGVFFNFIIYEI